MHKDCTVYRTVDLVSKRWTILILLELYRGGGGEKRYSEIKEALKDISPKILSQRLKELEERKMITKKVDASTVPIRTEYKLTEMGLDFIDVVKGIKHWALKWNIDNKVCASIDCKDCSL